LRDYGRFPEIAWCLSCLRLGGAVCESSRPGPL